jgi:hypothetical protein
MSNPQIDSRCNPSRTRIAPVGLLKLLAGDGFAVGIEALPVGIQVHFSISSVIVLIPNAGCGTRLLMARES